MSVRDQQRLEKALVLACLRERAAANNIPKPEDKDYSIERCQEWLATRQEATRKREELVEMLARYLAGDKSVEIPRR